MEILLVRIRKLTRRTPVPSDASASFIDEKRFGVRRVSAAFEPEQSFIHGPNFQAWKPAETLNRKFSTQHSTLNSEVSELRCSMLNVCRRIYRLISCSVAIRASRSFLIIVARERAVSRVSPLNALIVVLIAAMISPLRSRNGKVTSIWLVAFKK